MPNGLGAIYDRGLNAALERRFGVRDDVGMSLMPELATVIPAGDGAELLYHLGWRRYALFLSTAAVAANAGIIRCNNPAGSGVMVKVELLSVSSSVTSSFGASFTTGGPANLTTVVAGGIPRDGRQFNGGGGTGSNAVWSTDNLGAQVPTMGQWLVLANTYFAAPFVPVFLMPGQAINFFSGQLNQNNIWGVAWSERFMNDQENTA